MDQNHPSCAIPEPEVFARVRGTMALAMTSPTAVRRDASLDNTPPSEGLNSEANLDSARKRGPGQGLELNRAAQPRRSIGWLRRLFVIHE